MRDNGRARSPPRIGGCTTTREWDQKKSDPQEEKNMLQVTAILLAIAAQGPDAQKKDGKADEVEGTWVATSLVDHGMKLDTIADLKMTLTLKGGKYTLKIQDKVADEGTYTTDTSKSPKQIDTTASTGENKGMVDRGLYELKGDTLKTVFDEVAKQKRPTAFDSDKYQVAEFKRVKE
jgi:uncharacterized protein (TIGR03067 family)